MIKKKTLKIETVHECNSCLGNKTLHPLATAIDLSKADCPECSFRFGFYTVLLTEGGCEDTSYGRKYDDYSGATMIFLPPGRAILADGNKPFPPAGRLLAFHPNLILGTTLGMNIHNYTFFSYFPDEALHLSLREKAKALECIDNITGELRHGIDRHSKILISRHIELLLDYCSRFYERQFITRNERNKQILEQTDRLLDEYIRTGKPNGRLSPSAEYCSRLLHLSPQYFNDLLKFETGKKIHEYFQLKQVETAGKMLLSKENDVSLIAEKLGFPDVQHFSRLFRKITGATPEEYRITRN